MGFYDRVKPNFYDKEARAPTKTKATTTQKFAEPDEELTVLEEFPDYRIAPSGNIYNSRNKLLSTHPDTKGYLTVTLYKDSQRYTRRVHVLVAQTFLPIPEELQGLKRSAIVVDHIDQDRCHCSVDNLQWVTQAENISKAYEQGRESTTAFKVRCIEDDLVFMSCTKASTHYNVSKATIQAAIRERGGYVSSLNKHFEFV